MHKNPLLLILVAAGVLLSTLLAQGMGWLPAQNSNIATEVSRSPTPAAKGAFGEAFEGAPASPQPWNPPTWDVTVHSRDRHTWYQLEPMAAVHGHDCGPHPATHTISSYEEAVFQCRNHIMTAIQAEGYGAIYLTPNQLVDLSQGEAVIRFDLSTLRTSNRDWVDLWISPYADHLQLPLDEGVDLQGRPRHAIHIRMAQAGARNELTFFRAAVVRDFAETILPANVTPYEQMLTPDAARRDTFELRLSRTHVRFGMPQYNLWWVDTAMPELAWQQGVVQFGHHSYNPTKCEGGCTANTWHWDNVSITPAVPFTMIKGQARVANAEQPVVQLAAPAPAGSRLRFAAWGQGLEVSVDGGQSWQAARVQPAEFQFWHHFMSYWMEIPAGTTTVQFRNTNPDSRDWLVRDLSVWAMP